MKKLYATIAGISLLFSSFGQYENEFRAAYQGAPFLQKGLLEAIAYTNTHIRDVQANEMESCTGMPLPYGVMGVFDDGKNYFRENGKRIAALSGIPVRKQKGNVALQVQAYAKAYNKLMSEMTRGNTQLAQDPKYVRAVLAELSEIPMEGNVNQYAMDLQAFEIMRNLNNEALAQRFNFTPIAVSFATAFGSENLLLLRGERVNLTETGIHLENSATSYQPLALISAGDLVDKSANYGPAIWNAAPSCNYSSRNGTAISAVTIHTIQGSYAGAISWSQNCSSNVSYHYVIRSSDGQITQMVLEANKAWHVGNENPYTIGYEHEGYVTDASWYTNNMYTASAALTRDVCNSGYGISPLRTYHKNATTGINVQGACTKIKGHQHFPNQNHTDPGINWNWEKYYQLINPQTTATTYTASSGSFYDTGGPDGNYGNDERKFWLISPANAPSVTLNFSAFNLEANFDYMLIYNGTSTSSPLIGKYTGTTNPGAITASSGKMLIEFRSDCATVAAGWRATWGANTPTVPSTTLSTTIPADNTWKTTDFNVNITDVATAGIQTRFYLAGMKPAGAAGWSARTPLGFVNEDFEDGRTNWTNHSDTWTITSAGAIKNSSATNDNTQLSLNTIQSQYSTYLYQWKQKISSTGANQRAGLHFFASSTGVNRGNSYFVFFREATNKVQIYKVTNDVHTLVKEDACTVNVGTEYDIKVVYNPANGTIKVFVDDVLKSSWVDSNPITSGAYLSLRTGECVTEFDNVRMYRSRSNSVALTVGPVGHFNQKSVGGVHSGLLRSLLLSSDDKWSNEVYQKYLVDFSTASARQLTATLTQEHEQIVVDNRFVFEDEESQIASVYLALGSQPGDNDLMDWQEVSELDQFEKTIFPRQMKTEVYANYRVTNHAGMEQSFMVRALRKGEQSNDCLLFPNPASAHIQLSAIPEQTEIHLYDAAGRLIQKAWINPLERIAIEQLEQGTYLLHIALPEGTVVRSFVKH